MSVCLLNSFPLCSLSDVHCCPTARQFHRLVVSIISRGRSSSSSCSCSDEESYFHLYDRICLRVLFISFEQGQVRQHNKHSYVYKAYVHVYICVCIHMCIHRLCHYTLYRHIYLQMRSYVFICMCIHGVLETAISRVS